MRLVGHKSFDEKNVKGISLQEPNKLIIYRSISPGDLVLARVVKYRRLLKVYEH